MYVITFILAAVMVSVFSQVLVKMGLTRLGPTDFSKGWFKVYLRIFTSPLVLAGTFIYVLSLLLWIYSLAKVELSFAYPFFALSYLFIMLIGKYYLNENVQPMRWIGAFIIVAGILMVANS